MDKVELFSAWEWICPNCDTNNFSSSTTLDITPDDPQYEELKDGVYLLQPDTVKCKECSSVFETED